MTYIAITEHMSKDDRKRFDREHVLAPGKRASSGTGDIMRMMQQQGAGARGGRPGGSRPAPRRPGGVTR